MNSATAMLLLVMLLHPDPGELKERVRPTSLPEIAVEMRWGEHRILDPESVDEFRGDIHPSLFGHGSAELSMQWQPVAGDGFIAETVRGVLREHLENDPEYTTEGYGNEMARITGNTWSAEQQQWRVIPSGFAALDLGRIDPLLDTPLLDPSRYLRHLGQQNQGSEPIYRQHYAMNSR